MIKSEKIILLGKSGSGKDFLMRKLVEKGLEPGIKWTTRPSRNHELQGITYHFVDYDTFQSSIDTNQFICYQKFEVIPEGKSPEVWYYGLTQEEIEKSQIFIMTPGEFIKLTEEQRKGCFIVYLDISRDVRESRLFRRQDKNDSVLRRLDSDEEDFKFFSDYDLKICDPDFTAEDVYDLMD